MRKVLEKIVETVNKAIVELLKLWNCWNLKPWIKLLLLSITWKNIRNVEQIFVILDLKKSTMPNKSWMCISFLIGLIHIESSKFKVKLSTGNCLAILQDKLLNNVEKDSTRNGDFENDLSWQEELAQETERSCNKGLRSPCGIVLKNKWSSTNNEDVDIIISLVRKW